MVRLGAAELDLLNNALTEVCNGVQIEDWEFPARLGADRGTACGLLEGIGILLQGRSEH